MTTTITAPAPEKETELHQDLGKDSNLPPILLEHTTPGVEAKFRGFLGSIPEIFEAWVARRSSPHTQRAYRRDVMAFIEFMGISWPRDAMQILQVGVGDVQAYRQGLLEDDAAPKTINRRMCSLSSWYKYLAAAAAEIRLPVVVPNPAHPQFIPRDAADPVDETQALSISQVRQLFDLVDGHDAIAARDRALLKVFLYTAVRLGTAVRLDAEDFNYGQETATLRISEKGSRRRTLGIHPAAAQAISEYIEIAGLTSGPLFSPRLGPKSKHLSCRRFSAFGLRKLIQGYLSRLPGAMKASRDRDGKERVRCIYTPHSLRATAATALLNAGEDIRKVQDLLGHRMVTTTQGYDKRRRGPKDSASHDMPF